MSAWYEFNVVNYKRWTDTNLFSKMLMLTQQLNINFLVGCKVYFLINLYLQAYLTI